jgi:BirA family biotin operon repressor/biotin-[acetyl-CoA-carboxylase] ligase
VRDAIETALKRESVGPLIQVKWPNDVMADGKKLAGILIETKPDPTGAIGIVVGIGLNVTVCDFPSELGQETSLVNLGARGLSLSLESLLVDILGALEKRMSVLLTRGVAPLLGDLAVADYLRGRVVDVDGVGGRACGFDKDCSLLIESESGELLAVEAGHVQVLAGFS